MSLPNPPIPREGAGGERPWSPGPYLRGWLPFAAFVALEILLYVAVVARRGYGPGVEFVRRASWPVGFVLFHLPIYLAFGALLFFGARFGAYLQKADQLNGARPWGRYALGHIACVALLTLASWGFPRECLGGAFPAQPWTLPGTALGLYGLMLALIWTAVAMGLLSLAPLSAWGRFIAGHGPAALALTAGALAYAIGRTLSGSIEMVLHHLLFAPTVAIAAWLLHLFGYRTIMNPATSLFGTPRFAGVIGPSCLGYEGVALVLLLLGGYMAAFRRRLKFPDALMVAPAAALAIWLLNAARIALLIALGTSWSPAVATGGFHSGIGSVFLFLVATGAVLALERGAMFSRASGADGRADVRSENVVQLLPLLALMSTAMLTLLATSGFDWPYPARVLIVGAVLIALWRRLGLGRFRLDPAALGIGVAVFAFWLLLVPDRPQESARMAAALAATPTPLALGWILFRTLGAAVTVPVAEELAYRGYLIEFISRGCGLGFGRRTNLSIAAVISSLLFGALHRDWIAGCAAGLAYAFVRLRRDRLADAVAAHAATNLLLAAYVLASRHWSYW